MISALLTRLAAILLVCTTAAPSFAAINPEEYKKIASDALRLREIARVIATDRETNPTIRRVTIVAEVLNVLTPAKSRIHDGETVVIDYAVDLAALAKARDTFRARPPMPGPQFLYEPDPPELNATREFVAYLAPAASRLANVNRYAGAKVDFAAAHFSGPVFVPVAAQYSFELPR